VNTTAVSPSIQTEWSNASLDFGSAMLRRLAYVLIHYMQNLYSLDKLLSSVSYYAITVYSRLSVEQSGVILVIDNFDLWQFSPTLRGQCAVCAVMIQ